MKVKITVKGKEIVCSHCGVSTWDEWTGYSGPYFCDEPECAEIQRAATALSRLEEDETVASLREMITGAVHSALMSGVKPSTLVLSPTAYDKILRINGVIGSEAETAKLELTVHLEPGKSIDNIKVQSDPYCPEGRAYIMNHPANPDHFKLTFDDHEDEG